MLLSNSQFNLYTKFVILEIKSRFTYGESNPYKSVTLFHYIISMILYPNFYAGIFASGCLKKIQKFVLKNSIYPAGIYLFKVNNGNTRAMCEICLKLTTKKSKWRQWRRSGVFIVNFEQIVVWLCFHCWLWTSKCQLDCFGYRQFWFWKLWKQHNLLKRVKR